MQGIERPPMSSSTSLQQTLRRRRDSNELAVFEATKYFSGEIGTPRALRDAPQLEAEHREKSDQVMEMTRYVEEEGNCKQPCSPGGKLASLLYSLFQQSTALKNKKKKKKKLPKSSKSEIEEGKLRKYNTLYVSSSSGSEFPTPSLYSSKRKAWEEKSASDCCYEFAKQEELWSAEEKREFGKEEDGAESDSSSDLFELKCYDLNDLSTELPVFGSTDMKVFKGGAVSCAKPELPTGRR